jgi:hypothetical protein
MSEWMNEWTNEFGRQRERERKALHHNMISLPQRAIEEYREDCFRYRQRCSWWWMIDDGKSKRKRAFEKQVWQAFSPSARRVKVPTMGFKLRWWPISTHTVQEFYKNRVWNIVGRTVFEHIWQFIHQSSTYLTPFAKYGAMRNVG